MELSEEASPPDPNVPTSEARASEPELSFGQGASAVASAQPQAENTGVPTKRRRGRPRKYPVTTSALDPGAVMQSAIAPVKRGRGRPRKRPVQASTAGGPTTTRPGKNSVTTQVAHTLTSKISMPSFADQVVNAQANAQVKLPENPSAGQGSDEITPTMQSATTAPIKRRPGRPRKHPAPPPALIAEPSALTESAKPVNAMNPSPEEDNEDQITPAPTSVVKRGRGRPRKHPRKEPGPVSSPIAKRGPGRPRSTLRKDPMKEGKASVVKRGPGRPRKHPLEESAEEIHANQTVAATPHTPKRGPGRPRKTPREDPAEDVMEDEITPAAPETPPTIKRGRGRPRKHPRRELVKREIVDQIMPIAVPAVKRGRGRPRVHPRKEPTAGVEAPRITPRAPAMKRGPGRPRRHPRTDSTELENEDQATPVTTPLIKRGPGRPRKHPPTDLAAEPKKKVDTPVRRGRGRPRKKMAAGKDRQKKTPLEALAAMEQEIAHAQMGATPAAGTESRAVMGNHSNQGAPVNRGRGRPRKHPPQPSGSEPPAKRPRGRPRKNPVSAPPAATPLKRGRGRPRKQAPPVVPQAQAATGSANVSTPPLQGAIDGLKAEAALSSPKKAIEEERSDGPTQVSEMTNQQKVAVIHSMLSATAQQSRPSSHLKVGRVFMSQEPTRPPPAYEGDASVHSSEGKTVLPVDVIAARQENTPVPASVVSVDTVTPNPLKTAIHVPAAGVVGLASSQNVGRSSSFAKVHDFSANEKCADDRGDDREQGASRTGPRPTDSASASLPLGVNVLNPSATGNPGVGNASGPVDIVREQRLNSTDDDPAISGKTGATGVNSTSFLNGGTLQPGAGSMGETVAAQSYPGMERAEETAADKTGEAEDGGKKDGESNTRLPIREDSVQGDTLPLEGSVPGPENPADTKSGLLSWFPKT